MIDLIITFDHIDDHNLYSGKCKCQRKSGPPFNNGDDHLDANANSDHDDFDDNDNDFDAEHDEAWRKCLPQSSLSSFPSITIFH